MTKERKTGSSHCATNDLVKEKLSYEQEIFFRDCMRQSKSGVYAKSEEIYLKKKIMKQLKKYLEDKQELAGKFLLIDNILEEVYRYVKDHQEDDTVEQLTDNWIKTLE